MINVIKANKTKELFNEEKVINSIKRAGVPEQIREEVLMHVKSKLYEGISTAEILQHILEFLESSKHSYASSRYSLKEGIMSLGPTGYPFEDFISRLLQAEGYKTQVRQILRGECITHEIDVVAEKNDKKVMVEAKFHNSPGTRSQIHVGLYTQARFEDIKQHNNFTEAWLVTNTKTTVDVNTYALCKNIQIMSWSYPEGQSLRDLIERHNLHPVTLMTTINQSQKRILLENHFVMCRDIVELPSCVDMLSLSREQREKVVAEASLISKNE